MNSSKVIWIICQYAVPVQYGFGSRQVYIAEELVKKGYEVYIFSSTYSININKSPYDGKKLFFSENFKGINFIWLKGLKYKNPQGIGRVFSWFWFTFLMFFVKNKRIKKPDFVLVSSLSLIPVLNGVFYKFVYKAKFILEIRDIYPKTLIDIGGYSKFHPFVIFLRIIEKIGYVSADYIVGTMPKLDLHISKTISRKFKFKCIPQGIDLNLFNNEEALNKDFVENYIPKNKFIIGYAGAVGLSNALETLVEAARRIEHINPNIHFILLGDGNAKNKLLELAGDIKNLTFAPKLKKSQVQSFLNRCSVLYDSVKSCEIYNYGLSRNKWMDYMFSGKPLLVSYSGYVSLINEANCGTVVPSEDVDGLIAAIFKYFSLSETEINQVGKRGKEYVISNHTFDILASQYEEIFNNA